MQLKSTGEFQKGKTAKLEFISLAFRSVTIIAALILTLLGFESSFGYQKVHLKSRSFLCEKI